MGLLVTLLQTWPQPLAHSTLRLRQLGQRRQNLFLREKKVTYHLTTIRTSCGTDAPWLHCSSHSFEIILKFIFSLRLNARTWTTEVQRMDHSSFELEEMPLIIYFCFKLIK